MLCGKLRHGDVLVHLPCADDLRIDSFVILESEHEGFWDVLSIVNYYRPEREGHRANMWLNHKNELAGTWMVFRGNKTFSTADWFVSGSNEV